MFAPDDSDTLNLICSPCHRLAAFFAIFSNKSLIRNKKADMMKFCVFLQLTMQNLGVTVIKALLDRLLIMQGDAGNSL